MTPEWVKLLAMIVWALVLAPVVLVTGIALAIWEGWRLAKRYLGEP